MTVIQVALFITLIVFSYVLGLITGLAIARFIIKKGTSQND